MGSASAIRHGMLTEPRACARRPRPAPSAHRSARSAGLQRYMERGLGAPSCLAPHVQPALLARRREARDAARTQTLPRQSTCAPARVLCACAPARHRAVASRRGHLGENPAAGAAATSSARSARQERPTMAWGEKEKREAVFFLFSKKRSTNW